jgi:hypothetical protein
MKVINLNESQYRRLFETTETLETLGANSQSSVKKSFSPSETPTMVDGGVTGVGGEEEFVKNGNKGSDKAKKLSGSNMKSNAMGIEYPWTNRGIHY